MATYAAPVREIQFVLNDVLNVGSLTEMPALADATPETLNGLIEEAAKFIQGQVAPLNAPGDAEGCKLANGEVTVPKGFVEVYKQFQEAGWVGIANPTEWGGAGLPYTLAKEIGRAHV